MAITLPDPSQGALPTPDPGSSVASYRPVENGAAPWLATMGAAERLGSTAGELLTQQKQEQDRLDELKAEGAFTQLRQKQLDLTLGPNGVAQLKGNAALQPTVIPDFQKQFNDAADGIGATLANPNQQRLFQMRRDVAGLSFNEDLMKHVVQQGDVYAKEVYTGTIGTELSNVTAHWQDPAAIGLSEERIRNAVKMQADREGWAPELTEAETQAQMGKMNSAVVGQALASGNYKYAQDWYNAHSADIDKPTAEKLEHVVYEGAQKQKYADYSKGFTENWNSIAGLTDLQKAVNADDTLDPIRQAALNGRIEGRMQTIQNQAAIQQERHERQVQHSIDQANTLILSGFEPSPDQLAPILNAAKGTSLQGDAQQLVQTANMTRQFRLAGPTQQNDYLNQLTEQARADPTKFDVRVIQRFKGIQQAQHEQVQADPNTFAVRQGLVDPADPAAQPLDLTKPDQLAPQLAARFALGRAVSQKYQAPFKPLTQPEVATLTQQLQNSSATGRQQLLSGLATSAGGDAQGYKAMMAQIAPDNPVVAIAGVLGTKSAPMTLDAGTATGAAVSAKILAGQDILHPNKKADGTPSKGTQVLPPDKDLANGFRNYENGAFTAVPAQRSAYYQTAQAIYAKDSVDAGDYSQVINSSRWENAIKQATGGIDKWNGNAIVLPWGMDKSSFSDAASQRIHGLVDSGNLNPNADYGRLWSMPLKSVGDGRYVFMAGDGVLADNNKQPVVLDFNKPAPVRGPVGTAAEIAAASKAAVPVVHPKRPGGVTLQ